MSSKPNDALASIGIRDPIEAGREWAVAVWGVDGAPLADITPSLRAMLTVVRLDLEAMPHVPAFYVAAHIKSFEIAAKARLFDLHMSARHMGQGNA
ncbi:hypothetical protein HW509_14115 [Asaia spathodeae]|uniref:hypothetical protein n=1 Tax=Asaia spathodeae TaxID=657016 RepID=UPI002FC330F4